jgi:uncharacterized protein YgiM (DUF1202 family)
MRRTSKYWPILFVFVLLFVFSHAAASELQQQSQFVAPRLVVNTSFLNVRTGPGVQYGVLITVVGGTELPVLSQASDKVWFQVSTVVGVGWVNVQYTVPRGSFVNVPVVDLSSLGFAAFSLPTPSSLGLGQGGGGGAPLPAVVAPVYSTAGNVALPSTAPVTSVGTIRVDLGNGRATTVRPGERFRALINVEAVNIRTQPLDSAPTLGTLYRDPTNDYSIVGEARDAKGVEWLALDVADVGVGWIEAPKIQTRLSRASGTVVVIVAEVVALTDAPGGGSTNLPILTGGTEAFLVGISRDSNFVQLQLGGGETGWVPFNAVTTRTGTPSDLVDPKLLPAPGSQPTTPGGVNPTPQPVVGPQKFGLDTPHIVVNTGFLNIRSGPGAQYTIVATVPGGTELLVLGIASDKVWYLVEGPFGRGWVNNEFVIFRGVMQNVPIIKNATGVAASPTAVINGTVTLYAAPGTNFGSIATVSGPLEVQVVARTNDFQWVQVSTTFGFGWLPASQVTLRGDSSLIPIVG